MYKALKINDKVRHKSEEKDKEYGIMTISEIKGEYAVCMTFRFPIKLPGTFLLKVLKLAE
jgi:hypothetical protein